ncbi:MAG: F0F1 ATP synthase subunit gamma [Deltaproteobacteria bacterium]|nr:F0F1 ATP synthase subunit gamma [Deltaproteobacteria bacterium]
MSEAPRDLQAAERALDAVAAIRQVVQAVWTLARAQQSRVEEAAGEASAYLGWVEELVGRFGGDPPEEAAGRALWVVVGPERPFCGGLARRLLEQVPRQDSLLLVGRRLADAVPAVGPLHSSIVSALPAAAGPEDIDPCARRVAATLLELDHAGPVGMLHPADGGSDLQRAPLLAAGPRHTRLALETYSPPETVLAAAIHEALSGRLVVGLAEGLRTEVRARLVAADAARQGCDRKLEALRQQWRVLRQEAITGELLELFSGRLAELG